MKGTAVPFRDASFLPKVGDSLRMSVQLRWRALHCCTGTVLSVFWLFSSFSTGIEMFCRWRTVFVCGGSLQFGLSAAYSCKMVLLSSSISGPIFPLGSPWTCRCHARRSGLQSGTWL